MTVFNEETVQGLRDIAADLQLAADVKYARQHPHADLITAKLDPDNIWRRRNSVGGVVARMHIKGEDQ